MLTGLAMPGGAGGGGGGGGYSASSSATSNAKLSQALDLTSGGGNRGFINNFAGQGAVQRNEDSINAPMGKGSWLQWLAIPAGLIAALLIARKMGWLA